MPVLPQRDFLQDVPAAERLLEVSAVALRKKIIALGCCLILRRCHTAQPLTHSASPPAPHVEFRPADDCWAMRTGR